MPENPTDLRRLLHDALCEGAEEQTDVHATHDGVVDRIIETLGDAGYIVIPAPSFAYKGPDETDASRAREIADRIGHGTMPGSHSRATTASLLRRCAEAMESGGLPVQPFAVEDLQYGLHLPAEKSFVGPLDEKNARAIVKGPNPNGLTLAHRVVGPWVAVSRD